VRRATLDGGGSNGILRRAFDDAGVGCRDGNTGTRWSSAFSDPQWIQLDLGASKHVSRVVLNWEAAASRSYEVQVSDDGTSWRTIYSDSAGDGGIDDLRNLNGNGRYLRIYSRTRITQWGVSLWEIEVYGDANSSCAPPPSCAQNRLTGTSATASSSKMRPFLPATPWTTTRHALVERL